MKKALFFLLLAIPVSMQAQFGLVSAIAGSAAAAAAASSVDVAESVSRVRVVSCYQKFLNQQGEFIKYIDVELPDIDRVIQGPTVKACLRTVIGEQQKGYFLKLTYSIDWREYYVEYADLKKIVEGMKRLAADLTNDEKLQPDFLKNFYRADDGFVVGYKLSKPRWKMEWYMHIPFLSNKDSILDELSINIKDPDMLFKQLDDAVKLLEQLKSKAESN